MTRVFLPLFLFSALFLTISCKPILSVRSDGFSRRDLASVIVDTPDPTKDKPYFGERISINWYVPSGQFNETPIDLVIHVKLKNDKEKTERIPLTSHWGSYVYTIGPSEYELTGGILSYQVQLQSQGKTIAESQHKFWVEPVTISSID